MQPELDEAKMQELLNGAFSGGGSPDPDFLDGSTKDLLLRMWEAAAEEKDRMIKDGTIQQHNTPYGVIDVIVNRYEEGRCNQN